MEEGEVVTFAQSWQRLGRVVRHRCGSLLWVRAHTRLGWARARCVEYRDANDLDHSLVLFHCPACQQPLRLWWDEQEQGVYEPSIVAIAGGPDEAMITAMHCMLCAEVVYGVDEIRGLAAGDERCGVLLSPGGTRVVLTVLHAGASALHGWSCGYCGTSLCTCGCVDE